MEESLESHNTQPSADQAGYLDDLNVALETLTPQEVRKTLESYTGFERREIKPYHGVLTAQTMQPERRKVLPTGKPSAEEKRFGNISDAVDDFVGDDGLFKDELVGTILKNREKIKEPGSISKMVAGSTVTRFVTEGKLVNDDRGLLRVAKIGGGSGPRMEENRSSERREPRWVAPTDFEAGFKSIIQAVEEKISDEPGNEKNLKLKRRLNAFHAFDMKVAKNTDEFKKRFREAMLGGVFTRGQYEELLLTLDSNEVISGELPSPEPAPINEAFIEGIRIGAENWGAQHLEDEQGNKLPLTAENYIKSVGGVASPVIIRNVEEALDVLVERGIASRTQEGYVVRKISRIAKKESDKEKVSEIPSLLISTLENLADSADRPAPIKALVYSLKQPETTKEQANMLLETSGVLDAETKKILIGILFGGSTENVKEEIISGVLPYPDGYVPEPLPVVEQEPILAEDPSTRVKDLNKQGSGTAQTNKITVEQQIRGMNGVQDVVLSQRTQRREQAPVHAEPEAITPTPTQIEEYLAFGPMTKENAEMDEVLREELRVAREVFVKHETEYKQKIRADKKGYQNIMADLGMPGKQRPLSEPSQEYLNAQKAYKNANKALKEFIAQRDVKEVEQVSREKEYSLVDQIAINRIDIGVLAQEENERRLIKKMVESAIPPKERGIVMKVVEKWASWPLGLRVGLSAILLTAATGGIASVGAGVTAAGLRATRGLLGAKGAMETVKSFDGIKRKKREEARKKAFEEYAAIDDKSQEEKDEKLDEYLEDEDNDIKFDRVKKAAIATVVGGVTAAATGVGMNAIHDSIVTPGVKVNPDIDLKTKAVIPEGTKPKGSFLDKLVKKQSPFEPATAPKVVVPEKIIEAPAPEVYPNPVAVPLSSKGFIDTVDQLKQATLGQKLTPALEKLLNQSPQKIAMDLGLYKPGQAAESAFGFQDEKLSIDINGNLSLEHTGGNEVLMDSKGTLKPFAGKMFDADKTATSPLPTDAVEVPAAPKVAEVIPPTPKPVVEVVPEVAPVEIKSSVSTFDAAADAITPATALVEVKPGVPLEFDQTVIKSPEYTGPQDMVFGKLPLKPELQFDPKYKAARVAYNIRFGKAVLALPYGTIDLNYPIEYNGGLIYVLQKGKELIILLNGQEIGTGTIIDGEPGLQYNKSLGTSMFGVKSDFEKAFEAAEKGIMKNKMFFKKP